MSTVQLLRSGAQQFVRHPVSMLAVTAIPHLVGLGLVVLFCSSLPGRSGADLNPVEIWHAMPVTNKFLVFALLPLNTWLPFAAGLAGVSWIITEISRGEVPESSGLTKNIMRSLFSLGIPFFFLTFPWFIAFQVFVVPSVLVSWFIGFAPIAIATERAGWWRALKISSQVAGQAAGTTFTLWVLASVTALAMVFARIVAIPNASLGVNVHTAGGLAFMVLLLAVFESIFDGALTVLYSHARTAQSLAKPVAVSGTS